MKEIAHAALEVLLVHPLERRDVLDLVLVMRKAWHELSLRCLPQPATNVGMRIGARRREDNVHEERTCRDWTVVPVTQARHAVMDVA